MKKGLLLFALMAFANFAYSMKIQFSEWTPSDFESNALIDAGRRSYESSRRALEELKTRTNNAQIWYENTISEISNTGSLELFFRSRDNQYYNPETYKIYNNYKTELNKVIHTNYDNATRRQVVLNLKNHYINTIIPLLKEFDRYCDLTYRYSERMEGVTFDDFVFR